MSALVEAAKGLAEARLAVPLPRRWRHVQAVGSKADRLGSRLVAAEDVEVLRAAAWLHDVGYAPELVDTGFHSLDGARFLRADGFDPRVTALVAHHSCARLEAEERDLAAALAEFPDEQTDVTTALLFCDMTTGPDGQDFTIIERIGEIRLRYGPGEIVTRFIVRAGPTLTEAVGKAQQKLEATAG